MSPKYYPNKSKAETETQKDTRSYPMDNRGIEHNLRDICKMVKLHQFNPHRLSRSTHNFVTHHTHMTYLKGIVKYESRVLAPVTHTLLNALLAQPFTTCLFAPATDKTILLSWLGGLFAVISLPLICFLILNYTEKISRPTTKT